MTEKTLSKVLDSIKNKVDQGEVPTIEEQTVAYIFQVLDAISLGDIVYNLNYLISENTENAFNIIGASEYATLFKQMYTKMQDLNNAKHKGLFAIFKTGKKIKALNQWFIHEFNVLEETTGGIIERYIEPYIEANIHID